VPPEIPAAATIVFRTARSGSLNLGDIPGVPMRKRA